MIVPVLETERLRLRRHEASDLPGSEAMWTHPGVYRFIGGRAFGHDECWARLLRHIGHWEAMGYGSWLAEEKATGAFVGEIGLIEGERGIPEIDAPEFGWALHPDHHGKGYAFEAVSAALAWSDHRFARTVCMIDPENTPSLKLADRLGYREYHRTVFKEAPVILLERSA